MKKGMIKYGPKTHLVGTAVVVAIVLLLSVATQYTFAQDLKSESKAPAPLARMSGVAAVAKGKLYFIGGITKSGSATGVVHEYDPARNEWLSRASMPTPRTSAAAVEFNGVVYVLGGRKDNDVLSIAEKYDPASNSWSKCAPMPTARWHPMVAVAEGKIYAFGGIAGVGNARRVLDVVEVYDPTQDRWSSLPVMPIGNSNAGAAVVGSKIYLVGGRIRAGADASGSATGKVYVYDTRTGKWETGPSMSEERTGLEACAVSGTIYAVGGASRGSNTASVEVLAPGANKWTLVHALRKPRTDHNCAVLGQRIYVVGGASAPSVDGIEDTLEELRPSGSD
ncbi:MAG TPA: kelch repeat-containing protein [Phycisphaerae bacterium]|nr:kelch repeat-containing protein [Phycisphaerae bacterium]